MADYPFPLEKITITLPDPPALPERPSSSEPLVNSPKTRLASRSESEQLKRESAMRLLVQQTRQANSLPVCTPEELAQHVETWERLLAPVPSHMLEPAWERASQLHDWTRGPLLPGEILSAASVLIAEDRERRDREASVQAHRFRALGTFACRYCDDTGYAPVSIYCATFRDWRRAAYPCSCDAAPLPQRREWPGGEDWTRDRDTGTWKSSEMEFSLRCVCKFCQSGYANRQQAAAASQI